MDAGYVRNNELTRSNDRVSHCRCTRTINNKPGSAVISFNANVLRVMTSRVDANKIRNFYYIELSKKNDDRGDNVLKRRDKCKLLLVLK